MLEGKGEVWVKSPDWDSGDEGNSDTEESNEAKERSEDDMWNVRYVLGGHDQRQLFGFHPDASWSCLNPAA